jgi:hypothetical protein
VQSKYRKLEAATGMTFDQLKPMAASVKQWWARQGSNL